jgi:predicted Ser/Thr protein kinase
MTDQLVPERECKIVTRRDLSRVLMSLTPMEYTKFCLTYNWHTIFTFLGGVIISTVVSAVAGAAAFLVCMLLNANVTTVWAATTVCALLTGFVSLVIFCLSAGAAMERYPTSFLLSPEGFKFDWGRGDISALFPWTAVAKVTSDSVDFYSLPSKSITLTLLKSQMSSRARENHWMICSPFWTKLPFGKTADFRFQLETITSERDREKFINAIRQHVSTDYCDGEFLKISGGILPPSHTDIWLEKMSEHQNIELLEPGSKLSGESYEIERKLASGGQGTVYLAHATDLCEAIKLQPEQQVVIKEFILPVDGGFNARQRAMKHVQVEAELLSKIDHDKIIRMYDWFVTERRAFLVIEYIQGRSLRTVVEEEGKMGADRVCALLEQMCEILEYLHCLEPPVVHRDFTPENLMLTTDGKLKLIDFNVAQQLEGNAGRTVVGKHAYIPPEQFKGRATRESDIYAMGATLFFLLTGEDPEPISASHPAELDESVPAEMDELVAKLTHPNAAQRLCAIAEIRQLVNVYGTASQC